MKRLLITTAVIEIGAGLGLVCWPSEFVVLLLGSSLESGVAVALGRVTGVALSALALANWLAHYDDHSGAAKGVVSAMVLYNMGVVLTLGDAAICSHLVGVALWTALIVHLAMAIWCIKCLLLKATQTANEVNLN